MCMETTAERKRFFAFDRFAFSLKAVPAAGLTRLFDTDNDTIGASSLRSGRVGRSFARFAKTGLRRRKRNGSVRTVGRWPAVACGSGGAFG